MSMIARRATLLAVGLAIAGGDVIGGAAPLHAQSAPLPTLVIYGTQRCPTDQDGNEIVVCVRRKPSEQFRIPKELRELKVTPENESWAARALANDDPTAIGGVGSCSTVGPGGSTGCFRQQVRQARRENADKARDQRDVEALIR